MLFGASYPTPAGFFLQMFNALKYALMRSRGVPPDKSEAAGSTPAVQRRKPAVSSSTAERDTL